MGCWLYPSSLGVSQNAPVSRSLRGLRERTNCGAHLQFVGVPPGDLCVGKEIAAAYSGVDARIVDAGRKGSVLVERAGGAQQAAAGAGDHQIAWPQILEAVVGDPTHALGHRLVLAVDAGAAGKDLSALLPPPIDHPIL